MTTLTSHSLFPDPPVHPPFLPEVAEQLTAMRESRRGLSDETLPTMRAELDAVPVPDLTVGGRVHVEHRCVPGPEGAPEVTLTILRPEGASALPGLYYIHGGGLVIGNRHSMIEQVLPYAADGLAVVVSVEYRLAPEHRAPAQVDDSYAGLVWVADHAAELGIAPERLMVVGISAGGGLAAGVALKARDECGPKLTHQVLVCPMIDDRFELPSSLMLDGVPTDRNDNLFCWDAALGEDRGTDRVSPYVAPARAEDLSNLPAAFIDFGGSEAFRDELLTFAMRLSQAGVVVDAHMWGGGNHGFYYAVPDTSAGRTANAVRDEYIRHALDLHGAS